MQDFLKNYTNYLLEYKSNLIDYIEDEGYKLLYDKALSLSNTSDNKIITPNVSKIGDYYIKIMDSDEKKFYDIFEGHHELSKFTVKILDYYTIDKLYSCTLKNNIYLCLLKDNGVNVNTYINSNNSDNISEIFDKIFKIIDIFMDFGYISLDTSFKNFLISDDNVYAIDFEKDFMYKIQSDSDEILMIIYIQLFIDSYNLQNYHIIEQIITKQLLKKFDISNLRNKLKYIINKSINEYYEFNCNNKYYTLGYYLNYYFGENDDVQTIDQLCSIILNN